MAKDDSSNIKDSRTITPSNTDDIEPSRREGELIDCYHSELQNVAGDADSSTSSKVVKTAKHYNNYIASIVDSRPDSIAHQHSNFNALEELSTDDIHRMLLDQRKYTKKELKMMEEEIMSKYSQRKSQVEDGHG